MKSDKQRRKQEIAELKKLFDQRGFHQTASKIGRMSELLDLDPESITAQERFKNEWVSMAESFMKDFGAPDKFAGKCLADVAIVLTFAIWNLKREFPVKLTEVFRHLVLNMMLGRDTARVIINAARRLSEEFVEERVYLLCFAYLTLIESVFDDCVRTLYFLWAASQGLKTDLQHVREMNLKNIKEIFASNGFDPIFLKNWDEKNHLRNSIAHARFKFTPKDEMIDFTDVSPYTGQTTYSRNFSPKQFQKIALEIEHTVDAFLYLFLLLSIRDLLFSKNPFQ